MPVRWEILHDRKIVVVTATGVVTGGEIQDYMHAVEAEGAMSYGKLLIASQPGTTMPPVGEMRAAGLSMRDYTAGGRMGPLAIVISVATRMPMSAFADAAGRHRAVQVFEDETSALRWLSRQQASQSAYER